MPFAMLYVKTSAFADSGFTFTVSLCLSLTGIKDNLVKVF